MRATWVAVAVALWATPARAHPEDENDATPFGIRIDVSEASATVDVSFKLKLAARTPRYVTLWRPGEGVVTAASVTDASGTHPLTFVRNEAGWDAWNALMEAPATRQRAAMVYLTDSFFDPDFRAVSPTATTLTVDLRFAASTCFEKDARILAVPAAWKPHLPAALKRRIVATGCGRTWRNELLLRFPVPAPSTSVAARAGRFSDGKKQAAFVEVTVPTKVATVPEDLHTVFVIDASLSMTATQRTNARALVRSYLGHAPRSSVQIVTFARKARPLLETWSAASAARTLDKELAKVVQKNGSEVQAGLHEAGAWLAKINGTGRVVLITDERVAERVAKLSTETLRKELPAGTLVHVVAAADYAGRHGSGAVDRWDNGRWSELAATTEGIRVSASADKKGTLDALELVRPIAVDHVSVLAKDWSTLEGRCDDVRIDEGASCEWWGSGAGDSLGVEGLLWNKRWTQQVPLGDPKSIVVARRLIRVMNVDKELLISAMDAAQALSERWSMMAKWGGEGGYADQPGGGGTGWGTSCDDGCEYGTIGHGSGTGEGVTGAPIRDQLYSAMKRCVRDEVKITLTVETTLEEIVDVTVKATQRPGMAIATDLPQIETCVTEAVWEATIKDPTPREHATHTFTY
jgi:hypothetical protein